jgi:hypothetical protein
MLAIQSGGSCSFAQLRSRPALLEAAVRCLRCVELNLNLTEAADAAGA